MPATLSLTLEDARGRTTSRTFGMETQALLADYVAAIDALVAAIEPVTDLALKRAALIIPLGGYEFDAVAGSNVDVGATFSGWIQDGLGKKASMKIPGIKDTLVASDGKVEITGVVATFLALFEDAADFTLSDGEQIESWVRGTLDK